jgi:hypothetical protein
MMVHTWHTGSKSKNVQAGSEKSCGRGGRFGIAARASAHVALADQVIRRFRIVFVARESRRRS